MSTRPEAFLGPNRLQEIELFAWLGEDELGSRIVGLKQALTPAGNIPLVATSSRKMEQQYIRRQLEAQAEQYGKKIYLCRFTFAEVVDETLPGAPL